MKSGNCRSSKLDHPTTKAEMDNLSWKACCHWYWHGERGKLILGKTIERMIKQNKNKNKNKNKEKTNERTY